ncbi:MAG TPA: GAF and ANTAR domain-containing protein, partial [Acidimicrobiia bacterium]|nr:GAF and ANTAR domain-containing protein [Acidimicrobiia bacterium]
MADFEVEPVRLDRVAAALAVSEHDPSVSLCVASAEVVGVRGAGVALMAAGHALGMICVSDDVTGALEEVQYSLGEGPCVDAYHAHAPVLASDLADADGDEWPAFREGALRVGVRAAFGFPLMVRGICIGALNLYHDRPVNLTSDQVADAVAVCHVAAHTVLRWQSLATPGSVAWQLEGVPAHRAVVHQATGMISVQAGASVDDALAMLRAYAFA